MSLNIQQAKFLKAYLKSGNATQSAIEAGYSEDSAGQTGYVLLKNAEILEAIDKQLKRYEITAERVLGEISRLAFSNMGDFVQPSPDGSQLVPDFSNVTHYQMAAIQEVRVDESAGGAGDGKRERIQRTTFKLAPKTAALELLARNLKLLTDRMEITGDAALLERLANGRKRASNNA